MSDLEKLINNTFDNRDKLEPDKMNKEIKDAVEGVIWIQDHQELLKRLMVIGSLING